MKLDFYAYRYADAVLNHASFRSSKAALERILRAAPVPLLDPGNLDAKTGGVKRRTRGGVRAFFLPVDQKSLNVHLDTEFERAGWQSQPLVVDPANTGGPSTGLKADFKKGRLQVEIQFGNMARWYTDVFKFQLSYSLDQIDAAVLVVPKQALANLIDENVAYYERVIRELPWAKMSLTLPILVIGLEPDSYNPIRTCYERAFRTLSTARPGILLVPFDQRIREEPPVEESE